jgi:nicotinate-nucleotide pyrophosphorylase (carboxylating)
VKDNILYKAVRIERKMLPNDAYIEDLLRRALEEDVGTGDVTTLATVPFGTEGRYDFVAREPLMVCGLPLAAKVFGLLDPSLKITPHMKDGDAVPAGSVLMTVEGPVQAILTGERVALNFMQHLSAIATHTQRFVNAVAGTKAEILDTRKTTPGLRFLEKYAVTCGGGANHRMGLYDAVLIKDNHIAASGGVVEAIRAAKANTKLLIQVECDTVEQAKEAMLVGADRLLLDNMTPALLGEVVAINQAHNLPLEASGGVTLETIRPIAETGVDFISVGGLTHSAPHVDIGLDSAEGA